jgi:hypothetical protein
MLDRRDPVILVLDRVAAAAQQQVHRVRARARPVPHDLRLDPLPVGVLGLGELAQEPIEPLLRSSSA